MCLLIKLSKTEMNGWQVCFLFLHWEGSHTKANTTSTKELMVAKIQVVINALILHFLTANIYYLHMKLALAHALETEKHRDYC